MTTAWDQIETLATSYTNAVKKSDGKRLSKAKAIDEVLRNEPRLYERYMLEQVYGAVEKQGDPARLQALAERIETLIDTISDLQTELTDAGLSPTIQARIGELQERVSELTEQFAAIDRGHA